MISTNEIVRTWSVGVLEPSPPKLLKRIRQLNNEFPSLDEIYVGRTRVGVTLIPRKVGQTPHAKINSVTD